MPKPPEIQKIIDHAAEQLSEAVYECLLHLRNESEKIETAVQMRDGDLALKLLREKKQYLTDLIEVLRSGL